jgi:hypothetical protein
VAAGGNLIRSKPLRSMGLSASPALPAGALHHYMQVVAREQAMSEPLIVTIPHRLGKDEALRRIKAGVERGRTEFSRLMSVQEEAWNGDRLTFRVSAMGQQAAGIIDVYEGSVRLEVTLPWLLSKFAHAVQRVVGQKGQLLLEKK